jgi:hypothetical protein
MKQSNNTVLKMLKTTKVGNTLMKKKNPCHSGANLVTLIKSLSDDGRKVMTPNMHQLRAILVSDWPIFKHLLL